MPTRVLLVAKPWRGGLSHYMRQSLEEVFPGAVQWFSTQPRGLSEQIQYRRDRSKWRHRLVERINRTNYDLGLFIGSFPELAELKRCPGNVIWLNDHPSRQVEHAGSFQAIYVSDSGQCEAMRASVAGERFAGVLPFAHLPVMHRPAPCKHVRRGVCFIGNRDPKRDAPIERLLRSGLQVYVYGNYFLGHGLFWRHPLRFRPRVPVRAMAHIYGRHQVSLNVHAQIIRGGTNMRTFECAGYGIPQVVEYSPGLDELFEPGREILIYHDLDEMVAQMKRLLADPKFAAALAEAARMRVLAEHTYVHRVETIRRDLGL